MRPIHFNNMNFLFRITLFDADGTDIGIADSESVEVKFFKEYAKSEEDVWLTFKYPSESGFYDITRSGDVAYFLQLTREQVETVPLDTTLVVQITHGITDARFTEDGGVNYITEKGKVMIVKDAL